MSLFDINRRLEDIARKLDRHVWPPPGERSLVEECVRDLGELVKELRTHDDYSLLTPSEVCDFLRVGNTGGTGSRGSTIQRLGIPRVNISSGTKRITPRVRVKDLLKWVEDRTMYPEEEAGKK
jgi:hypothetical protein